MSGQRRRWSRLFRREPATEVEDELAFHFEQRVRDYMATGMDPEQARAAARERLGELDLVRRECSDLLTAERRSEARREWARISWLDFRLGFRMLVRYPGLTLVGGLALAFAIAVAAITFEGVTRIVHPSLPLPDGDGLVAIRVHDAATGRVEGRVLHDFVGWRESVRTVRHLAASREVARNVITSDGRAEPAEVSEISAAAFRLAGVRPLLGRTLEEADEAPGAPSVLVLGYDAWQRRFGGDPGAVGSEVRLGSEHFTVVGVMPEGFAFPLSSGLWVPLRLDPLLYERGKGPDLVVLGRLAPGATLEQAQAELSAAATQAAAEHPDTHQHRRVSVLPMAKGFLRVDWRAFMAMAYSLNGAIVAFLLLVCANVATLVFARATTREHELVVRSALGAGRARIVSQLSVEALVLGGLAALVGLTAAGLGLRWSIGVFETVQGESLPFWLRGGLAAKTVIYTVLLTLLVSAVVGALPALKVTGGLQDRLREASAGGSGLRFGRLWTGIIVAQVAFTVLFVSVTAIVARDTAETRAADIGFPAQEYLGARLAVTREAATADATPGADAADPALDRFRHSREDLERRLEREPGVLAVTFASQLPGAYHRRFATEVEGITDAPEKVMRYGVQRAAVAPDFFDALGMRLVAGRGLRAGDGTGAPVVVVNESFVRHVLGGRNAVGRHLRYRDAGTDAGPGREVTEPGQWYEIVGVVEDVVLTNDPDLPTNAGVYHPLEESPPASVSMAVHVGMGIGRDAVAPALRELATAVDPDMRLHDVLPMEDSAWALLMTYQYWLKVLAVGAAIVLLLATMGIYALMSFVVSRRTREIGIRLALGASRRRILSATFARALAQVGLGVAIGTALVGALGVRSLAGAAMVLGYAALTAGICLLAGIAPVRRALRIEPVDAMRAEG